MPRTTAFTLQYYQYKNNRKQIRLKDNDWLSARFLDLSDKISYLCAIAFDIEEGKDMRTSAAMENLWLYLQSLPKSNKKWLSEKLIEDLKAESEETISKDEILAGIDRGLKDVKAGKTRPAEELLMELRNEL